MRVVFMGTGEISLPSLAWLAAAPGIELVAVFTQPDKPAGRKQALNPPATKILARDAGIPVFQPDRLRGNAAAIGQIAGLAPDLIVVMAYGQILPRAVIDAPRLACVNLHASLLPRHRGASPVQAAIREGDAESGITLMHIVPALDAGDMILKRALPLAPGETGGSLHDKLAALGPEILEEGIPLLASGAAPRQPQDEALATHAPKLAREDGEIDWSLPAPAIARLIRAYHPWPGTTAQFAGERGRGKLKVFPPAEAVPGPSELGSEPGQAALSPDAAALLVRCGEGTLLELRGDLQLEGRKRLPAADFLRGHPVRPGTKLG